MGGRRMNERRWSWVGASSTGTSHQRIGVGCDDAGACIELHSRHGPALIAAVSDGAGSAEHSSMGARIVVSSICRSALAFTAEGGRPNSLDRETVDMWLDEIRDRIENAARLRSSTRRSFAATLVACMIQQDCAVIIHVGDGACALRLRGERSWLVPSWPAQGEYASTTYFVTDDPKPNLSLIHLVGEIEEIALFTDGLERLALDFAAKAAFAPFFESMFSTLRTARSGRQRRLSDELRTFLDGPSVIQRTDDDKTLIMARRNVTVYKSGSGTVVRLGSMLGKGGEGTVHAVENDSKLAAKIYLPGLAAERQQKLSKMTDAKLHTSAPFVAFPIDTLFDSSGAFAGFTMLKMGGHAPVHKLYSPTSRKVAFPTATYPLLLRTVANAARAIATVHASGCVIGDINHSGVLVADDATVVMIDSDSFQFSHAGKVYPCKVGGS